MRRLSESGAPFLARPVREEVGIFCYTFTRPPIETFDRSNGDQNQKPHFSQRTREMGHPLKMLKLRRFAYQGKLPTPTLRLHGQLGVEIVVNPVAAIRREDRHDHVAGNGAKIGGVDRRRISGSNYDIGIVG